MPDSAVIYDGDHASHRLFGPTAEIVDQTDLAARLARQACVAAVQDQPVMRMQHEFGWNHLLQPELDFERRVARRQTCSVADPEYMGIHRHGVLAERHVEHDIRRLASRPGQ